MVTTLHFLSPPFGETCLFIAHLSCDSHRVPAFSGESTEYYSEVREKTISRVAERRENEWLCVDGQAQDCTGSLHLEGCNPAGAQMKHPLLKWSPGFSE